MQKILIRRERIILCLAVSVIALSAIFNLLLKPVLKKREILNKRIEIARTKLKNYIRLLSRKDYIQDKYKKLTSGLNISAENKGTLVTALSVLENLAKDANIHIIDIRPQAALVDLRTEGSMEGYLKFLYNLENSLSLLRIKKFQLNAKPNSPVLEGVFSISQLSLTENELL